MRARSALHAQRLSSVDTCIVAQIPTVTKIEPYFNQNWFSEPFCDQFWLTKPFLNHFWSYFGSGAAARNHEPPPSVIINSSATRASSGFLSSPIYDSWLCSLLNHPSSHQACSSGRGRFAPCCAFALGDVKGKVYDKLSTVSTHSASAQHQALLPVCPSVKTYDSDSCRSLDFIATAQVCGSTRNKRKLLFLAYQQRNSEGV